MLNFIMIMGLWGSGLSDMQSCIGRLVRPCQVPYPVISADPFFIRLPDTLILKSQTTEDKVLFKLRHSAGYCSKIWFPEPTCWR